MAAAKSDDLELEDGFEENGETDNDEVAKANAVKNSLTKRRVIDELLEERRAIGADREPLRHFCRCSFSI